MEEAVKKGIPPPTLTLHPGCERRESMRQQLQMADTRGIATVVRQLIKTRV
jgi:E3 ubiquitin-protein ligase RNF5